MWGCSNHQLSIDLCCPLSFDNLNVHSIDMFFLFKNEKLNSFYSCILMLNLTFEQHYINLSQFFSFYFWRSCNIAQEAGILKRKWYEHFTFQKAHFQFILYFKILFKKKILTNFMLGNALLKWGIPKVSTFWLCLKWVLTSRMPCLKAFTLHMILDNAFDYTK